MTARLSVPALCALLALSACGENEVILKGPREAIRPGAAGAEAVENRALPISLGAARVNANWTHIGGAADHAIAHPALSRSLTPLFSTKVGTGASSRTRLTAEPVVVNGRIFTMDAGAQVVATGTNGQVLWTRSLVPAFEKQPEGSGGGLAAGAGYVFASSGFGEVVALDPASGEVAWKQDLDAPGSGAPTVSNGQVFIAGRDGTAWAIEADTGRVSWTLRGGEGNETYGTGAAIAATGDIAIIPLLNGEVVGAFPLGGLRRWSTVVAGARLGHAVSVFSDISGDPVISGNRAYVGNISGSLVALDIESGDAIWSAPMAAEGPVSVAGGSVFLVNDRNHLVRLDASDGSVIWQQELPQFAETRWGKPSRYFAHYGPVLAGGRLLVASSDGALREFDPRSGAVIAQHALSGPAAAGPVVAGNTLYVITTDAVLQAFR